MNNTVLKNSLVTLLSHDYTALLSALSHVAILSVTDHKGNILYVNDRFLEVSKYSCDILIGKTYRILKSGHQPDEIFADLWRTISGGDVWRGEIKNRAQDGSYYWVDTSIAPILNHRGKPERYIAVQFLVTEKKYMEEGLIKQNIELEKSKKIMLHILADSKKAKAKAESLADDLVKFKFALDGISDQVIITDPNGIVIYANAALENITGFCPKEILGKKAGSKELWGGHMRKEFYKKLWDTIKVEHKPFIGEIMNRKKNGLMYQALSSISPILNKDGILEYVVAIERDITKEKEIDKAKTEFVSLASHQLRTPLSAISWWTEMLLAGDAGALSGEQKKYLDQIYQGSQRMVELVNALLNVSRIELGTFIVQPELSDIIDICKTVIKEMQSIIDNKKIYLIQDYGFSLPKIYIDPNLIRIIFQNLISNSVKYTPEKGHIKIQIELRQNCQAFDGTKSFTHAIFISVSDTGFGIPAEQQKNIFTKLFRADNAKEKIAEGTGLGLYIVQSIIEHSGGKIWFESEENKGTTFFVLLPLSGKENEKIIKFLN